MSSLILALVAHAAAATVAQPNPPPPPLGPPPSLAPVTPTPIPAPVTPAPIPASQPAGQPPAPLSPTQLADTAPARDWRAIAASDLLVMTLVDGRSVIIQLAPEFAPRHVDAVRRIALAGWWNTAATIYRVQDNYVAQWGDASERLRLPPGIADNLPAEYDRAPMKLSGQRERDAYARRTGFSASGWPVAGDGKRTWLPHCYGYVGVGRGLQPSTGSGAELYAVIGHAPRHLDRNIAVVGRVVAGIAALSALPRGTGALGFYEDPAQRAAIRSIVLASSLPVATQPRFEYLDPTSATFTKYQTARENREPPFFERPAGGADVCNIPVPVRAAK